MSTVSLEERFAPFLGIQFVTKSKITGRLDWNRERRAALNFSNAQINEYNSYEIVGSLGFKKNNIKLPFRGSDGKIITLKNDLNFTMNVTFRDLKVLQRRLDGDAQPVQGNYQVQIRPEIRYQFNKRIGGSLYFDHTVNDPFVSNSFYRRQTLGGFNLRFALSD
jgi:cell surface protein SprA